jgi:peptidoglycan/xylan/chitin deacetylase (PgdA/CDA1 family)
MIALKIDIDTHDGMKTGVPRLLACLARHRARATFFLTLGPDRMGRALLQLRHPRFARKMLTTNAPSLYGWRTILSGTLLPARPVATAFPGLVTQMESEGHEAAIHAWDHRAWQDDLPRFKHARIKAHFDRSLAAYRALTGHDPAGIGAPAWTTTPDSLALQDRYPFTYASDLRGGPPCRLLTPHGVRRIPQLPGTGPCLEELLGQGPRSEEALVEALLAGLRRERTTLTVLTLHAEVEGGAYLPVLERLLPRLAEFGELVTMVEAARRLGPMLPVRRWLLRPLPGRAFPVSTSAVLPPGTAA